MERRHEPRFPVASTIRVIVPGHPARMLESKLIDISATGIRFIINENIKPEGFVGIEVDSRLILAEIRYAEARGDKYVLGARRVHEISKDEKLGDAAGVVSEMLGAFHYHITDGDKKDPERLATELMERIVERSENGEPVVLPLPAQEPIAAPVAAVSPEPEQQIQQPEILTAEFVNEEPASGAAVEPEVVDAEVFHEQAVQQEAVREEDLHQEIVRELAVLAEAVHQEGVREEDPHQEAVHELAVLPEAVHQEAVHQEAVHQQAVREEVADEQAFREEDLHQEVVHEQRVLAEAVHQEAVHQEAVHQEAVREEVVHEQAVREEAVREEVVHEQAEEFPHEEPAQPEAVEHLVYDVIPHVIHDVIPHVTHHEVEAAPVEARGREEVEIGESPAPEAVHASIHEEPIQEEPLHKEMVHAVAPVPHAEPEPEAEPVIAQTHQPIPVPAAAALRPVDPLDAARSAAAATIAHMQDSRTAVVRKNVKRPILWGLTAAIVAALLFTNYLTRRGDARSTAATPAPVSKAVPAPPVLQASAGEPAPPAAPAPTGSHARLQAKRPVWVSISSDDQEVFTGMLRATEVREFDFAEKAVLRVGQGSDVDLSLNGDSVQVAPGTRSLQLTSKGIEMLHGTSSPSGGPTDVPKH